MEKEQLEISQIGPEHIANPSVLQFLIYNNDDISYYWSNNWSPRFYIQLAYAGFISIATTHDQLGELLMPEIQHAYALLDWKNLHISRNVKKIIRKGSLEQDFYLTLASSERDVVEAVAHHHHDSWLSQSYQKLLHQLKAEPLAANFRLLATELRHGRRLVAGELGYAIGCCYTSLTGFCDKGQKIYNHMGTIQLLALAALLKQGGYAFWNLGHPYMQYKFDLGARKLKRQDFLNRWQEVRDKRPPAPLQEREGQKIPLGNLLRSLLE